MLKALAKYERYDLVYDFITSTSEHSWTNMIWEGATACYEAWGKEQKWNTSLCHPWASSPIILIIEDLIGIHFEAGKLKDITPHLPKVLSKIKINVSIQDQTINLDI